jgi:hypothetical protein
VTVGVTRPDSWSLPLFLHVLGAVVLFGGTLAVTTLGIAAVRSRDQSALLARVAFRSLLLVVLPGWILMRAGAEWIVGKEFPRSSPGWIDVGFAVSEGGLVLLIVLGVLGFLSARRDGSGRVSTAFAVLVPVYLAALVVAWFAMSAKPGS